MGFLIKPLFWSVLAQEPRKCEYSAGQGHQHHWLQSTGPCLPPASLATHFLYYICWGFFLFNILQCLFIDREKSPNNLAQHIRLSVYIFIISCLFPTLSVLRLPRLTVKPLYVLSSFHPPASLHALSPLTNSWSPLGTGPTFLTSLWPPPIVDY